MIRVFVPGHRNARSFARLTGDLQLRADGRERFIREGKALALLDPAERPQVTHQAGTKQIDALRAASMNVQPIAPPPAADATAAPPAMEPWLLPS